MRISDWSSDVCSSDLPLYVVAKSPIARLEAWAKERRWPHLRFLSDVEGHYSADYFGDTRRLSAAKRAERGMGEGEDWDETIFNVFCKDGDAIRHHWASEMAYAPEDRKSTRLNYSH